jgi:hypothetical protein
MPKKSRRDGWQHWGGTRPRKWQNGGKAGGYARYSSSFARCFRGLERFQAKWRPVRVKRTRQNKNPEPRFDSIETERL